MFFFFLIFWLLGPRGRDGRLFRVDFGFAFGRTPEIDAPGLFVPNAVYLALGDLDLFIGGGCPRKKGVIFPNLP